MTTLLFLAARAKTSLEIASASEASERYANKVVSIGAVPLVMPPPGDVGEEGVEFCCPFCCATDMEVNAMHKMLPINAIVSILLVMLEVRRFSMAAPVVRGPRFGSPEAGNSANFRARGVLPIKDGRDANKYLGVVNLNHNI